MARISRSAAIWRSARASGPKTAILRQSASATGRGVPLRLTNSSWKGSGQYDGQAGSEAIWSCSVVVIGVVVIGSCPYAVNGVEPCTYPFYDVVGSDGLPQCFCAMNVSVL